MSKQIQNPENPTEYKLTECEEKLLEALLNPENRMKNTKDLCQAIEISRDTYYASFKKPEFVKIYKEMSKELVTKAVGPIINSFVKEASRGSFQHGKVLLEMADLYTEKTKQEVSGPGGGPVETKTAYDFSGVPKDDLTIILETIQAAKKES
jgi:hypothetical protein